MQQNLININKITYLVGNAEIIENVKNVCSKSPFADDIIEFLNDLSKKLMSMHEAKMYPDVVTLAFWIRKSSVLNLKERFVKEDGNIYLGRGVAFHIAPSNVPVNYAYSLVTGLLTGNANIVRIPSKEFPQVSIINKAIIETLEVHEEIKPYICLVRYDRNQSINDDLSSIADIRIIWGGDATINELRKSNIGPRATEITFADRYSLSIINSEVYLNADNKEKIAEDFYNDTYLTDQNACTSPRIVIWTGNAKAQAKKVFWVHLHHLVRNKYSFQPIMGINKLASSYLLAVNHENVKIEKTQDNLIVRIKLRDIDDKIMEFKDNSGYFFEYDCDNILDIQSLCNNTHCQTIGLMGDRKIVDPLFAVGIKGVDRVVPIGKTMDFDLIWDGYNLVERLTRTIKMIVD